jgi:hypothetical protein
VYDTLTIYRIDRNRAHNAITRTLADLRAYFPNNFHPARLNRWRVTTLGISGVIEENGAQGRDRTTDTRIFSPLLYQLSYLGPLRRSMRRSLPRK